MLRNTSTLEAPVCYSPTAYSLTHGGIHYTVLFQSSFIFLRFTTYVSPRHRSRCVRKGQHGPCWMKVPKGTELTLWVTVWQQDTLGHSLVAGHAVNTVQNRNGAGLHSPENSICRLKNKSQAAGILVHKCSVYHELSHTSGPIVLFAYCTAVIIYHSCLSFIMDLLLFIFHIYLIFQSIFPFW